MSCYNNGEIQVASCTMADLLGTASTAIPKTSIRGQLSIPEYQRPYIWNEKQINRLLNDLIEHKEDKKDEKPMYYLGSIILHQDGNKLKIIDGQQRITTLLLLQKIKSPAAKNGVVYTSTESIKQIEYNLSYLKSIKDRDIFDYRDVDLLSLFDFNQINVTLIVTHTEDLAYTFFETQNTGGVRLSGSDIVKAHHLRAILNRKMVNHQARRWEAVDSTNVENIIQKLTKVRFWDNRKWRHFPLYREERNIKSAIIDEYTVNTRRDTEDISFYYSAVKNEGGRLMQMHESTFKQIKQPLSNGNNTLDYINDYIHLHAALFKTQFDYRIEDEFYNFRNTVLHGKDGTVFLKELMEISLVAYVSRFGFYRLYEATLWLYRAIYSLRVSNSRNVREDSVHKFVYENQFIDNILEVFTPDELFMFLKRFSYMFNTDNTDEGMAKAKHLGTLKLYFKNRFETIDCYKKDPKAFDKHLIIEITKKVRENGTVK